VKKDKDGKTVFAERDYQIVLLEDAHVKLLWDVTPWLRELSLLSNARGDGLFDGLPAGPLRNALFHLLWHATEISLEREPLTVDKQRGG
jgi:hypothetical protein